MEYFTKKSVIYGTRESEAAQINVDVSGRLTEAISILKTNSTQHFTEAIAQNAHETENITGLDTNKVYIRGINIQSMENLHFRLIFWSKDIFNDTDLDVDTYLDHIDLDIPTSGFRIGVANQYYLNVSGLGIIYEDEDDTDELHCSLQNLSVATKSAGTAGAVQIDILYTVRD